MVDDLRAPARLPAGLRGALASLGVLLTVAGAGAEEPGSPPRPSECRELEPGADLAQEVDALPEGAALCLAPGRYTGPLRLGAWRTVWGPRSAVILSQGEGTTVELVGQGAALLGVSLDGSGGRHDLLDAAVAVRADDARVEGVEVRNALFGLLAEQANRVVLRGNRIVGNPASPLGMRGDGVRIWEVRESRIEENHLEDSRDMVVWYASGNRIAGNTVLGGRYGTHLMYSHDNQLEGNRYDGNVVGVFLMYSRNVELKGNQLLRSSGAAGMGLGLKESGNIRVEENLFAGNQVCAYVDTSPLSLDEVNVFEDNWFRSCGTGVVFHGGAERNLFSGNSFRYNAAHVQVEGRGDAQQASWRGNDFDDYAGYDLDGDGVGDVPYELRSLSGDLTGRHPTLAFFRGAPAMTLVELVGRVVPLFRPTTVLVDAEPRMRPRALAEPRTGPHGLTDADAS